MNLTTKISAFYSILVAALIAALVVIGLYSFRQYSMAAATDQIRTSAEIVRVTLTEDMINGVIAKREGFLQRLMEVQGLKSARVLRGAQVEHQFGRGLNQEQAADDLERRVLESGREEFALNDEGGDVVFRGTIPFVATKQGTPNCLQCHLVAQGSVLGAVTITMSIEHLRRQAFLSLSLMVAAVALFVGGTFLMLRRMVRPIVDTANNVEAAVQRAIDGNFKAVVEVRTKDEIGKIAGDMNRLLAYLDQGLNRIGHRAAQLTNQPAADHGNLLEGTIEMVETLTEAAGFKQAIEEDESKQEIYDRLAGVVERRFGIREYSLYEIVHQRNQMQTMVVDGEHLGACRWCDPQILVRNEACRARRTGHTVDASDNPAICYAFRPPKELGERRHICFPVIQSGTVGSVLQLVVTPDELPRAHELISSIRVYLRETAPVLEAKRLMETLKQSTLRDPMTGLHNRRFLEEAVETLMAQAQRHKKHMAILMLDLDYFKMVNDEHGHDAGDAVLKSLSRVLTQAVRASDIVIRYGGEEFLIILQETGGELALPVAEKIRAAVAALKVQIAGNVLQKTISIGISDFPGDSDTFWQAVKFADVALYRAKETGRNRVVRFSAEMWEQHSTY